MLIPIKILLILPLVFLYIQCDLSDEELSVLEELSNEWGVDMEDCTSGGIDCCPGETICRMYVYN